MQCPDCGAVYSKEDLFCGECGRPLSTETPPGESSSSPRVEDQVTATHKPAKRPAAPAPVAPQPKRSFSKLALILGVVIFLLLCLCVAGAGILFSIVEESVANPTGTVPAQGDLLYQDDFRDPGSGWDTWSEDATSGKYVDGEYRLAVYREDYMAWSYPADAEDFKDAGSRSAVTVITQWRERGRAGGSSCKRGKHPMPSTRVCTPSIGYAWSLTGIDLVFM